MALQLPRRHVTMMTYVCFALLVVASWSFAPKSTSSMTATRTKGRLVVVLHVRAADNNSGEDSEEESIEEVRKKLMASLGGDGIIDNNIGNSSQQEKNSLADWREQLETAPPLTTIGRERMVVEMEMLQGLVTKEELEELAQRRLWYYWYNERGRTNTATLMEADKLVQVGTPEAWKQAEELYRQLIVQEGVNWAEPLNRLATLLFYDKRYAEAKDLCQMVLTLKPWHFGCQTGIVMICEKMGDVHGVEYYSRLRMPPLRNGDANERTEWVNRMVKEARGKLSRGEKSIKENFKAADSDEGWE
jgi:hypothetical protein